MLATLWFGRWFLAGLVFLVVLLGCWELRGLAWRKGDRPSVIGLFGGALLLVYLAFRATVTGATLYSSAFFPVLFGLVLFHLAWTVLRIHDGSAMHNAAVAIFGSLYLGGLGGHLLLLRSLDPPAGPSFALWAVLVVWANDIGAYGVGLRWGRHKLIPRLSPAKSLEGALAGLGTGLVVGWILGALWFGLSWGKALVLALAVGVAGQVGDLCESGLKRDAGVKDSGRILPGHGGVLDRFDSLLVAVPVLYYLLFYWQ